MSCAVNILVIIHFGQRLIPVTDERGTYTIRPSPHRELTLFPLPVSLGWLWVGLNHRTRGVSGAGPVPGLTLGGQPPSPSFLRGHWLSEPTYLGERSQAV